MAAAIRGTLLVLASVCSGVALVVLGSGMTGLGRGWIGGGVIAMIAGVTAPVGAVVWLARRTRLGRIGASLVVVVNALNALALLTEPFGPEAGQASRVWSVMPGEVVVAGALLVFWQIVPLAALRGRAARNSPAG